MVHAVAGKSTFLIKHVLESVYVCFVTSYKRVADNSRSGEWSLNMRSLRVAELWNMLPVCYCDIGSIPFFIWNKVKHKTSCTRISTKPAYYLNSASCVAPRDE